MEHEIDHVKSLYPKALFVGSADGAKSNWDFFGPHIDEAGFGFLPHYSVLDARGVGDLQGRRGTSAVA
jgi:hypothetical protein